MAGSPAQFNCVAQGNAGLGVAPRKQLAGSQAKLQCRVAAAVFNHPFGVGDTLVRNAPGRLKVT